MSAVDESLETPGAAVVMEAARRTLEAALGDLFEPDRFEVAGDYDQGRRLLSVSITAPGEPEVNEAMLVVFYDIFFELPFDAGHTTDYRFEWRRRCADGELERYLLETRIDCLPETGGVTRERWDAFLEQLVYTCDGSPQQMPEPDEFVEQP